MELSKVITGRLLGLLGIKTGTKQSSWGRTQSCVEIRAEFSN